MSKRIYTVENNATGGARLVRATHPSHALRHVAADAFTVRVSTQDDLETLLPRAKVEDIAAEQQQLPTT
jgi:hypothetical protein